MATFPELAAQYLTGFAFTITAQEIPPIEEIQQDWAALVAWWRSLDERTKRILETASLADGLQAEGFFTHWPKLYDLFKQNPYGGWGYCFDNIETAVNRAYHAAQEQAETGGPTPYQPDEL